MPGSIQSAATSARAAAGGRPNRPSMRVASGTTIVLFAAALLFVRARPDSYDSGIMVQLAAALAHGSITVPASLDLFGLNSPHSSYGIGTSLVMLAFYLPAKLVHFDRTAAAMSANALLFALTGGLVVIFCRLIDLRRVDALICGCLVCLGTPLLAYTATGFSEVGVAASSALGLVGLAAMTRSRPWGAYAVGAAAGAAALFRSDSLVLVVPILVLAAWIIGRRRSVQLLAGAAPFAIVWLLYNQLRFGAPWDVGYHNATAFNHPFLSGLYGLLLSPGKGVLWYSPLLAVSLFGVPAAITRNRVLAATAASLLLARVLFYAPYWGWNGGGSFGPRMLVPAMPALAVGIAEVVRRLGRAPRWRTWALAAVTAVSIAIQVVGASIDYNRDRLYWTFVRQPIITRMLTSGGAAFERIAQSPAAERVTDQEMFNWSYFPIVDESRELVRGENLDSATFSPHLRPGRLALSLALLLIGIVVTARSLASTASARKL